MLNPYIYIYHETLTEIGHMMDKGEISTSPNVIVRFNPGEDFSCTPSSLAETSDEICFHSHINSNRGSHSNSEAIGNGCTPTLHPVTVTPIRYSEIDKCVHYAGTITPPAKFSIHKQIILEYFTCLSKIFHNLIF